MFLFILHVFYLRYAHHQKNAHHIDPPAQRIVLCIFVKINEALTRGPSTDLNMWQRGQLIVQRKKELATKSSRLKLHELIRAIFDPQLKNYLTYIHEIWHIN